jgi:hypothetical protein
MANNYSKTTCPILSKAGRGHKNKHEHTQESLYPTTLKNTYHLPLKTAIVLKLFI